MWEYVESIFINNFDKFFFSMITVIIVGAAIMDIRDKNQPPGPMGIPFFGYLLFLNQKTPFKQLMSLTHQYGRVFRVQFGSVYAVVVADVKLIKETLSKQEFQAPVPFYLTNRINQENGISRKNKDSWTEHRNFVSTLLKNIGKGQGLSKTVIETQIQESVREFLQDIRLKLGDEQDILPSLQNAVGLMMMGIVMGKRYDRNDPDWEILQSNLEENSQVPTITSILNYISILRSISSYGKTIQKLTSGRKKAEKIYMNLVESESSKCLNGEDLPESVLHAYLVQRVKHGNDNFGKFSNKHIQEALSDLVNGGWETSLATLKWLYLYMAMYPEIQEIVAKEVEGVVGAKGEVRIEDLDKLPYTEATILEIWRHQTIVPLGVPQVTKEKTKIGDYIIPENAMVIPLLWAVHHDSRLWEKPEVFCPERFLYEDGCIFRNENLLPFQTGNQMCIGEELGRGSVKLFFANTLNQFQIQFPKGYSYNILEAQTFGTTLVPRPYQLFLQSRHK